MMRDLPIGLVIATVSIAVSVVFVCLACLVAWWPQINADARYLFEEDAQPPAQPERHGAPSAHIVNFQQRAAKGFGVRKGRPS